MAIDVYLDRIDDVLEEAWNLPFTGGKRMIDIEKIRELIDEIRLNLPQEIKDARAIVADREEILSGAKAESEELIKKAEERARKLVSEQEVVISAKEKAKELITEAHGKSRAAERAALEFSESTLKKSEDSLLMAYNEIKNVRAGMRSRSKQERKG